MPAATADRMPDNSKRSAIRYAANGISNVITTPGAGSPSSLRLRKRADTKLNAQLTAAPVARPPTAMITKLIDASRNENTPVSAAAIANFNATRPDASFINASPSRICISRPGILPLPAIPLSATASVGDNTAASAKATGSGIDGTSACTK
ncbi:hypothetical protein KCU90_g8864, partial [Aureobasidium melanogenum]